MLGFVEPEADWLDIRWCHEDDDETLHRELAWADVVGHVLRPLSGADLRRGEVGDEAALVDALSEGRLAGAGLDVFAVEPLSGLDNVVTPHVVWYTVDTMRRSLTQAVDNRCRLRDGQDLVNVVNGRPDAN